MIEQTELPLEGRGEAPRARWSGEARPAAQGDERSGIGDLMEKVVARENCLRALKRVRKNKGSPGIDGMCVEALPQYLRENWEWIRAELLEGSYRPSAVRRHEILKSGGGVRQLGIPTVLDRFIQQAVLQVLQPIFDPTFSEYSYGFRPGRSAHDAVCQAQRYVQSGRNWVVVERHEGTPQGGPLSPLLANVLLDEVDRMLEKSGHQFVRYADDCNVYVRSKRAGERVMGRMVKLYAKLRLKVNEEKSTVAPVRERKFLGYSFWVAKGRTVKRRVAPKALENFKERIRQITSRNGGRSLAQVVKELRSYVLGWKAYFRLADTPGVFRNLDQWIARRLRMIQVKQWKRATTAYREMRRRGVPDWLARRAAKYCESWWAVSKDAALHRALPTTYLEGLGLPRLAPH